MHILLYDVRRIGKDLFHLFSHGGALRGGPRPRGAGGAGGPPRGTRADRWAWLVPAWEWGSKPSGKLLTHFWGRASRGVRALAVAASGVDDAWFTFGAECALALYG